MRVRSFGNCKSGIISNSKPNTSRLGSVSFLMWNPGIRSCLFWVAQVCSRKCCAPMCPWGPWVSVLLPWHLAMAISGKRCFAFWRRPFCRFFFLGRFGTLTVCFFFLYLRPERRMKLPYHHFPGGNHLLTQLDFKSARFESLMKDASWQGEILLFSNADLRGDDVCESESSHVARVQDDFDFYHLDTEKR